MITVKSITDVVSICGTGIQLSGGINVSFPEYAENFHAEYRNSGMNCIGKRDITTNPPYFESYTGNNHITVSGYATYDSRGKVHDNCEINN